MPARTRNGGSAGGPCVRARARYPSFPVTERRIGRRGWLAGAGLAAAAVPVGLWLSRRGHDAPSRSRYGALRPDPRGALDLLEGFSYRVLERAGDLMSDGQRVPPRPDGMACMRGSDGSLVLMRNHELPGGLMGRLFGERAVAAAYDPTAAGGVTRVVLDARTLERRSSNLVLAGTVLNCSGGPSPFGWLSCEETTARDHGYVFLCDPDAESAREPVRVDAYGRFKHEAAAVDPARAVAYLTEDEVDSCLYRFVPHDPARPFEGRLSALAVRGRARASTGEWRTGERVEVEWVELEADAPAGELRHHAQSLGAATFRRGEGACAAGSEIYFAATIGGPAQAGQIFRLADEGDGGTLEVFTASTDRASMDMPDNLTIAPNGTLFFAEDGQGQDYVRGVSERGEVFELARNAASDGEITGVCFSPDGRAMFLNLQEDGLTLVVEGPFDRLA